MLDDRDKEEGDEVTKFNEATWRKKFCEDVGHTMPCVKETVEDMSQLVAKVCGAFGGIPVDKLVEQIGVEKFDKHLRAILKDKKCNCNEKT